MLAKDVHGVIQYILAAVLLQVVQLRQMAAMGNMHQQTTVVVLLYLHAQLVIIIQIVLGVATQAREIKHVQVIVSVAVQSHLAQQQIHVVIMTLVLLVSPLISLPPLVDGVTLKHIAILLENAQAHK